MPHLEVSTGDSGDQYVIETGGHRLVVDQPAEAGGTDTGPTPTDLLIASLASCVAHYAGRYLRRHGFERDGLRVDTDWDFATDRPARVGWITMRITVPAQVPAERMPALLAVARHCTVHNTIEQAPPIEITADFAAGAAAG